MSSLYIPQPYDHKLYSSIMCGIHPYPAQVLEECHLSTWKIPKNLGVWRTYKLQLSSDMGNSQKSHLVIGEEFFTWIKWGFR